MSYEERKGHVLQVQSQVVHGFVGNSASTLPLNMLGFQNSNLNVCQYSNHLGYDLYAGRKLTLEEIVPIINVLKKQNFYLDWTHILSGYLGSKEIALALADLIRDVREQLSNGQRTNQDGVVSDEERQNVNKKLIYVCDPVLGDNGKLYVSEELVDVYRNVLLPMANVVTPNAFEAEQLSNIQIHTEEDAIRTLDWMHDKGVEFVFLTSAHCTSDENKLTMIGSRRQNNSVERYKIEFAKLEGFFSGTGDVTAALITSWLSISNWDVKKTMEMALGGIQSVLRHTPPNCDLNLISCRNFFANPVCTFEAVKLE